jgi:ubiquinone/menaquinone biosynthesis C-methylase UbiE/uncharacterized protein YbaR (Trm112 family)
MQQSLTNKKGEIIFRKKLLDQQINGIKNFDDEFNKSEIENILLNRMATTVADMKKLKEKGFILSPYLELGAERCQRSLAMENDVNSSGAALDLSFDMLKSCEVYKTVYNKKTLPLRICCDAYNLPFRSNSIPFAFCYQTLHHFPEISPIINEMHRVLQKGGSFYFDDEPFKKVVHLNLYTKRERKYSKKERTKKLFLGLLDYFFARISNNEESFGILENEAIPLKEWKSSLAVFAHRDIELRSLKFIKSKLFKNFTFLNYLLGGNISGICTKEGILSNIPKTIVETLICPECKKGGNERELIRMNNHYSCSECKKNYYIEDGVLFLLTTEQMNSLYPELQRS